MKFILIAALFLGSLTSCTNEEGAMRALRVSGYKNIQLRGYSINCGRDDGSCTGFTATAPNGEIVSGAVGCGLFIKGCTIRFE